MAACKSKCMSTDSLHIQSISVHWLPANIWCLSVLYNIKDIHSWFQWPAYQTLLPQLTTRVVELVSRQIICSKTGDTSILTDVSSVSHSTGETWCEKETGFTLPAKQLMSETKMELGVTWRSMSPWDVGDSCDGSIEANASIMLARPAVFNLFYIQRPFFLQITCKLRSTFMYIILQCQTLLIVLNQ